MPKESNRNEKPSMKKSLTFQSIVDDKGEIHYLMQTFFSLRRRSKSRGNFGGRYDEVWWFGGNDPFTKVKVTECKTQRVRL